MSKSRRAFLRELPKLGTAAVAGSAVRVSSLDKLAANTGVLNIGLLIAGDRGGAHTIIGGRDGGIQMYSEPNKLVFSVSPQNGGRLRLGALDAPGITMTNGNVAIDGNCIVDGTLSASKLQVGELASVFLEDDKIEVGTTGDLGFSGLRIQSSGMAGYKNGQVQWYVSNDDGSFRSGDFENGFFTGVILGENALELVSSLYAPFETPVQHIKFSSILFSEGQAVGGTEARLFAGTEGVVLIGDKFTVASGGGLYRWLGTEIRPNGLAVQPIESGVYFDVTVADTGVDISGGKTGAPIFIHHTDAARESGVIVDANMTYITNGLRVPIQPPSTPYLGCVYFDVGTNTLKVYSGDSTWKTIAYVS